MKSERCKTKYPVMLVHGIGYNDIDYPEYWGRIPKALEDNGATIYFGKQDGFGKIAENAGQLKLQTNIICEKEGAEKINIIAHSKGGIESRYMISVLGMGDKVATLTTMATPHHGIKAIDDLKKENPGLLNRLYGLFNIMLKVDGGQLPETNEVYDQLTYDYMEIFNHYVKNDDRVYYQSYAFDMVERQSDPAMGIFYTRIKAKYGPNDGLVPVTSAVWGDFRGVYSGPNGRGVSHPAACDGRVRMSERRDLGNISELYIDIVEELRVNGY